jgi:hypothetical protein
VRDGPGDGRNGYREYRQRQYLLSEARVHKHFAFRKQHGIRGVPDYYSKTPNWANRAASNYGNHFDSAAPALACSGTKSICWKTLTCKTV